jgi:hypothetical protein
MSDGSIRNQPWCRTCRSGAGAEKPKEAVAAEDSSLSEESPSQDTSAAGESGSKRRNVSAEVAAALAAGRG